MSYEGTRMEGRKEGRMYGGSHRINIETDFLHTEDMHMSKLSAQGAVSTVQSVLYYLRIGSCIPQMSTAHESSKPDDDHLLTVLGVKYHSP